MVTTRNRTSGFWGFAKRTRGEAYAEKMWPAAMQLVKEEMGILDRQARDFLDSGYGYECASEILQRLQPGYKDQGKWSNLISCLKHFDEEWDPELFDMKAAGVTFVGTVL